MDAFTIVASRYKSCKSQSCQSPEPKAGRYVSVTQG